MADVPQRALLEEYVRRQKAKGESEALIASIRGELFRQQLDFIDDTSRNKVALCTRRAGKTSMWARYCTQTALRTPRSLIRIWAVNRLRAKQLLWEEFRYLFQRHMMAAEEEGMHETELTIRFRNGSEIRLLGADKDKEAQKKRGDKTIMEVVLEAQGFGSYLRTLVEEVAEPCLFDLRGTFCLEGTPGRTCGGYWFDASGRNNEASRWTSLGDVDGVGAGWSCHRWSVLDNPFIPHAKDELADVKQKRRWDDSHPTYVREWLGKWVIDASTMYYAFDEKRNTYREGEVTPWGPGWQHSLGWDLGSLDSMALVVWGWHPSYPDMYEAFSWKRPGTELKHGVSDVMAQIDELERRGFNFVKKVADTGGGGRMMVEEVMLRHHHVFEAAKKTEKYEYVQLFNDDLRTGKIKLRSGSLLAREMAVLPKDPDWDPKSGKPPAEDPNFENHCLDSSLYSWRAVYNFLYTAPVSKPIRGSEAFNRAEEDRILEAVLTKGKQNEREYWEPESDYPDAGDDY